MNIISALRTPVATLVVLGMALIAQLPHAADVFRLIVGGEGWTAVAHGYAYAVALELAVLLFVVQRRDAESYLFAAVSVLVNLSYYALHGIDLFSVAALPAWLVSIALPVAIARYSHLLVETPHHAGKAHIAPAVVVDMPAIVAQESTAITADADEIAPASPTAPQTQSRKSAQKKRKATKPEKLTPAQRQAQIAESGTLDAGAIVAQFGVSMRTAQADIATIRAQTMHANGVQHELG